MKKLINKVQERKACLKAKIALHKELAVAFLFVVDQQCQLWLDECLSADDCSEVNNSSLDFNNIISKILLGEYNIDLLKTFISATKKTHCKDSNQKDSSKKKKSKKDQNKKRSQMKLNTLTLL
eukprot:15365127-Ditylum_brightwellii.AAC.1